MRLYRCGKSLPYRWPRQQFGRRPSACTHQPDRRGPSTSKDSPQREALLRWPCSTLRPPLDSLRAEVCHPRWHPPARPVAYCCAIARCCRQWVGEPTCVDTTHAAQHHVLSLSLSLSLSLALPFPTSSRISCTTNLCPPSLAICLSSRGVLKNGQAPVGPHALHLLGANELRARATE
eukprot:COSAG02_NODE_10463_length_1936_cov_101.572482_2_plen_177_part_00